MGDSILRLHRYVCVSSEKKMNKKEKIFHEIIFMQQPLKERKNKNVLHISSGSCSTTEDMQEDGMDADIEECVRSEISGWLATHGSKLFSLEASKFLAAESKRGSVRSKR